MPWEKSGFADRFVCAFEIGSGRVYTFEVARVEDTYSLRMRDESDNEIFSVSAEQPVVFGPWEEQLLFSRLRDLFELARRKGLAVDQKLAEVASLLDAIRI